MRCWRSVWRTLGTLARCQDPDRDPHTADEKPWGRGGQPARAGRGALGRHDQWKTLAALLAPGALTRHQLLRDRPGGGAGQSRAVGGSAGRSFSILLAALPWRFLQAWRLCWIQIREGSEHYAKDLEERLKERIFVSVFPQLARGLLSGRKTAAKATGAVSQDELDAAFHATLILLYRLLFFLYAEARDLLPVREQRGYREKSLLALRKEIADAGGPIAGADQQERIAEHYSETEFELWKRPVRPVLHRGPR